MNEILQNAATATGNGEPLNTNYKGAASIALTGTFSGTVTFEASHDNTNWFAIPALNRTTQAVATTATTTGLYHISLPGVNWVRARISAYTSGNITAHGTPAQQLAPPIDGLSVTLTTGDVEIGAVEIKNASDDARAVVKTDGTNNALVVTQNAVIPGTAAANLGKAEDAAHASGDTGVMLLGVNNSADAAFNASAQDYTPISVDGAGNVHTKDRGAAWTSVFGVSAATVVSADATSATAVTDAPTSGQKIVITDIIGSSDTAMNILFEEETSGTDIFKIFVAANSSFQITPRSKIKLATINKKLTAKASVAGNVAFTVCYYSEA